MASEQNSATVPGLIGEIAPRIFNRKQSGAGYQDLSAEVDSGSDDDFRGVFVYVRDGDLTSHHIGDFLAHLYNVACKQGSPAAIVYACYALYTAHTRCAEYAESLPYLKHALAIARRETLEVFCDTVAVHFKREPSLLREAIAGYHELAQLDQAKLKHSRYYFQIGYCHKNLYEFDDAIKYFKMALKADPENDLTIYFIEVCLLERARSVGEKQEKPLRDMEIFKGDSDVIGGAAHRSLWNISENVIFFPRAIPERATGSNFIASYILPYVPSGKFFNADSFVLTFGSCFAEELRTVLTTMGHKSANVAINEGLNNTFALRDFFSFILTGEIKHKDTAYNNPDEPSFYELLEDPQRYKESICDADGIIITLGVAEVWRDKLDGGVFWKGVPRRMYDPNRHEITLSTVQENKENILEIHRILRTHVPKAKIFITLSPIPLNATFRDISCVEADCASKSVLRAAIEEVMLSKPEEMYYWPSFEMVRWTGSHVRDNVFGLATEAANWPDARHPVRVYPELIVKSFVDKFFHEKPGPNS